MRLDPDHKKCSDYYKMLRKLNKLIERMRKSHDENNYADCVSTAQTIIDQHPNSMSFYTKCQSYICACQSKAKNTAEAIEACSELLRKLPNDAETLYNRAQAYIVDEQLENGNLTNQAFDRHSI